MKFMSEFVISSVEVKKVINIDLVFNSDTH